MTPFTLCLATSLGLHGFLWQWGVSTASTAPRMEMRQGEVAVELNLLAAPPTPVLPAPSPKPTPAVKPPPPAPPSVPEISPEPIPPPPPPDALPEATTPPAPEPAKPPERESPPPPPEASEAKTTVPDRNASPEPIGIQQRAEPTQSVSPVYPRLSRRRGEEGVVVIAMTVTHQGKAENIVIQQSSGYPLLDKAALRAIRRSQFRPARKQGIAITSTLEQTVEFKLEN